MPDLFSQDDQERVRRLTEAGWVRIMYYGSPAWRSPDGKKVTSYTQTAIAWLEDAQSSLPPVW